MNWRNVRLVLKREIVDQLRDRRTLFMIAVLPVLLYPLVGMTFIQLKQFMQSHKTRVLVVGRTELDGMPELPPLFVGQEFAPELTGETGMGDTVELVFAESEVATGGRERKKTPPDGTNSEQELERARKRLAEGEFAAVVYFPPHFGKELATFREQLSRHDGSETEDEPDPNEQTADATPELPQPEIIINSAKEQSTLAEIRLTQILHYWSLAVGQQNLRDSHVPLIAARPFRFERRDVASGAVRQSAIWAKILPFVVFVWALTGAFYPAIDLCAGEKERGTLETLLASPASRAEIVWGKLLTVMIFSMATALLNLASLGGTGHFVVSRLKDMPGFQGGEVLSSPPLLSVAWLVVALVPISALFSALCLALAAFAKSTREGQYYLLPVLLVTAPLMILAISPGVELDLGKALVPISGLVLLLRTLIEGNYALALPYVLPVLGVTSICCLLAIRWAVEQFSRESVLFRESERFDLKQWAVHVVRDRRDTPSIPAAFAGVMLIFFIQFFVTFAMSSAQLNDFRDAAALIFTSQAVVFLVPAVFLTLLLSRNRRKTLLLEHLRRASHVVMAVLLACALHPVGQLLGVWIQHLYPPNSDLIEVSKQLDVTLRQAPYAWMPFALLALLPALCEEVAFRGFILSGFRRLGHKWWAIALSAFFFGIAHQVVQQSISAAVLGLVLGYVAVQTNSLIPCMMFHFTYNSLMLLFSGWVTGAERAILENPTLRLVFAEHPATSSTGPYWLPFVALCAIIAFSILLWFQRLPFHATAEEDREERRIRQGQESLASEV